MKKLFLAISVYLLSTPIAIADNCCVKCKEWGAANLNIVVTSYTTDDASCESTVNANASVSSTYSKGCWASGSATIGTGVVKNINTTSGLSNPFGDGSSAGSAPCYFDTTNKKIIAYSKVNSVSYQCAAGYYGTATSSGTGCTACPTYATCTGGANPSSFACDKSYYKDGKSCYKCPQVNGYATTAYSNGSADDDDITDCFVYTGHTWHDTTGNFELSKNCYYSTTEDATCICGTSTNYDCSITACQAPVIVQGSLGDITGGVYSNE